LFIKYKVLGTVLTFKLVFSYLYQKVISNTEVPINSTKTMGKGFYNP